ncbi:helix-turn-helix domain-containing protein [Hyalangium versicolor]|uniref:helix-turn-helix domain-containing protein n=1 Tax=Hyalangium versicolor TaxID=2861190 RepID=UPI001CCD4BE4|nr:LysR family transcriptional regulator [Hyalangium versicolor]
MKALPHFTTYVPVAPVTKIFFVGITASSLFTKGTMRPDHHLSESWFIMAIITPMNLSAIDLNLFVVLHAVLAERSATRAAARLHVTQSAVSNALARPRRVLGDPLVVRTRRGLSPTPRALALQPQLEAALGLLEGVTREGARFDLHTARREWVILSLTGSSRPADAPAPPARPRPDPRPGRSPDRSASTSIR